MNEFLIIAIAHFLAVASPGPDFIFVFNQALKSRFIAIWSSLGIALGILVHLTYSLIGIALIISKSIVVFNTIKFMGAGYLIYLGFKSLQSGLQNKPNKILASVTKVETPLSAVKKGFLVNALNPKASLFFLALFTQVINPATSQVIRYLYGLEMFVATFVWFAIVSIILTQPKIKSIFEKIINKLNAVTGVILIAIGLKVVLEK
jgi:RhtB (resistance to homoserine/threonine) family protein